MTTDTSRRQERIDRTEERTSPSAGWRAVYAAMGVPSDGGAETETSSKARNDHTLDEYADRVPSRTNDRTERNGHNAVTSD
ncbi:hypothetical protein [Halalkalicoccus ordinarius]|uniref:hypothetical protein n=1 Tax=Halalkalicoccus ordinarius TaxID=3116651 RepID=UPI00300E871B